MEKLNDLTCIVCGVVFTEDNIKNGYCYEHTNDTYWLKMRKLMIKRKWPIEWAKTWKETS